MDLRALGGIGFGRGAMAGALALAMATGCPGDDSSGEGSSGSAESGDSTGGTSGGPSTGGGTATGDTGVDSGTEATATDAATTEATDTGMEVCQSEPTEEVGAVLEVAINVENDTAESYWVIDFPDFCDEFAVSAGGEALPRTYGHRCGCECPAPPSPSAMLVELMPGQTHSLRWDGRAFAVYSDRFECGPGDCWSEPAGSSQPVEPGSITVTVPLYDAAEFEWPFEEAGAFADVCPSPLTFEVPVELGTEDVEIDVALSTVVP